MCHTRQNVSHFRYPVGCVVGAISFGEREANGMHGKGPWKVVRGITELPLDYETIVNFLPPIINTTRSRNWGRDPGLTGRQLAEAGCCPLLSSGGLSLHILLEVRTVQWLWHARTFSAWNDMRACCRLSAIPLQFVEYIVYIRT